MDVEKDIAYKIQNATRGVLNTVDDLTADEFEPQLKADREGEQTCSVVKVSTFITAVHLMCARWVVQGFPKIIKGAIEKYAKATSSRLIVKFAAKKVLDGVPSPKMIAGLAGDVVQSASEANEALALETDLRAMCAEVRKDFNTHCLSQKNTKGRRKVVTSRHATPRTARRTTNPFLDILRGK